MGGETLGKYFAKYQKNDGRYHKSPKCHRIRADINMGDNHTACPKQQATDKQTNDGKGVMWGSGSHERWIIVVFLSIQDGNFTIN